MATKRKRVSAADRRDQILSVARELFAKQGFRGTTTRQIADQAQVNEAILFRHFRSKEALYWAVLDHLSRQRNNRGNLQALIAERTRSGKPHADEALLRGNCRRIVGAIAARPDISPLVSFQRAGAPFTFAEIFPHLHHGVLGFTDEIYSRANAGRRIPHDEPAAGCAKFYRNGGPLQYYARASGTGKISRL